MLKETENLVEEVQEERGLSRRKALGLGAAAVGAVAAGGLLNAAPALSNEAVTVQINGKTVVGDVPAQIISGRTMVPIRVVSENMGAKVDWVATSKTVQITTSTSTSTAAAPALPWTYQKLDVEAVRKAGYENYAKGGCMYGAAAALINEMAKIPNTPWKTIPLDMYKYGAGGVSSWGTLCGALNGAIAVMSMAVGVKGDLIDNLMNWYQEFPFPSTKFDAYAKFKNQVTSVCKSPLCHASVSTWCDAAKAKVNSDEKKDRCAKLTGDVAAYVAEMLNETLAKNPVAKIAASADYSSCLGCHAGATSMLDNEQGKMNCLPCHDDAAFKTVPHKL